MSALPLWLLLLSASAVWATSTTPLNVPDPNIPSPGCPTPDNHPPSVPGMQPGNSPNQTTSSCPPGRLPPQQPPGPQDPEAHNPGNEPSCDDEGGNYHFNPVDAPDSLPTLGERVRLEAVFGAAGPIYRWGRHIGFGGMARLNYLSKALLARDLDYLRVCDPTDNSTAVFERVGGSWEYALVEGEGYADGARAVLDRLEGGIPRRLSIVYPNGALLVMEHETSEPSRQELDSHVYRVTERRTREGHSVRIAYQPGRVVITDASGHDYVCEHEDGRITSIHFTVDGQTRGWDYVYNDATFSGKDSHITEVSRQTGKRITNWLHGRLVVTELIYTGSDGKSFQVAYPANSWNNRGHVRYIYRTLPGPGQAVFTESSGENRGSHAYDTRGLVSRTDGLDNLTRFERNRQGLFTRKTFPDGTVQKRDYDGNGNLLREEDPAGVLAEHAYDARGNRLSSRLRLGEDDWAEYRYVYDARNLLVSETDPEGGEIRHVYNAAGLESFRLTRVAAAEWSAVAYVYDGNGQVVRESVAYALSDPSRPELGVPAEGSVYRYDRWGNLIELVDPLGNASRYEYDAGNQLTAEITPLGQRTEYVYDSLGKLISRQDALGNRTLWTYNAQGRVASVQGLAAPGCSACGGGGAGAEQPGTYAWSLGGLLRSCFITSFDIS